MNLLELITKNDPTVQVRAWNTEQGQWQDHDAPHKLFFNVIVDE